MASVFFVVGPVCGENLVGLAAEQEVEFLLEDADDLFAELWIEGGHRPAAELEALGRIFGRPAGRLHDAIHGNLGADDNLPHGSLSLFDRQGYLFGSYRIATAPEPNSSRLTSFKSIRFDSPANNVGPWPASVGCTTNSYSSINSSSANASGSFTPPTSSPLPGFRLSSCTALPRSPRT